MRYLCTNFARCPLPTAIEIKGVVRAGTLPEALETGALTPARLRHDGENNAKRTNSRS